MGKKVVLKTRKKKFSVSGYLNAIEPESARRDARRLAKLFKETTGARPQMWGESIVGYGQYTYYRSNGDEGSFMATGFAMRKSGPVVYIMPGYKNYKRLLNKLGSHKLGKSCLYLKDLQSIDLAILRELISAGIDDLKKTHTVKI
ncbi:MAG: DUF1801 domain-containing protein [Gammaproteobacteria bacterium]|nr:DUF1801 domain-containing protein [Gammaproteobacteria bacterium]